MTDTTEVGNQLRLDLLREALPYIQRFKGKTFVVKFCGKVTEEHAGLISLAEELALLYQVGIRVCVVHGSAKQLTELPQKMRVEQTIIEARRVTDEERLEMAKMICADTIASAIAIQLKAEKLVLLSDVDGIYLRAGEPQTKLSRLTADEAAGLIEKGSASGGMIPKLQSIVELLRRGVKSAHIINGNSRNALLAEVFTDKGTGTMIVA